MRSNFSLFKETQWCWCFFILFYVVPSIPALPVRATTATLSPGHGENALSFWSCISPALPWVLLQNLLSEPPLLSLLSLLFPVGSFLLFSPLLLWREVVPLSARTQEELTSPSQQLPSQEGWKIQAELFLPCHL